MSDTESDYEVGPGKPPLHTRFKKGQSGNPRGRHAQNLPALLVAALNQPVAVSENGRRRQVTKREAVIASAGQQIRHRRFARHQDAARQLDILKDIEKRAGTAPMNKPAPFTAADEEVIENLVARLRRAREQEATTQTPRAQGG
jgi:hypothetical protein